MHRTHSDSTGQKQQYVVNTDKLPLPYARWEVKEHRAIGKLQLELRHGQLFANDSPVIRYLSDRQKKQGMQAGESLRRELADRPTLNATVRDFLIANPELIPEDWKHHETCFWGTIFRSLPVEGFSGSAVAYLLWNKEYRWWNSHIYLHYFGVVFGAYDSAAMLIKLA
jgi:hypothetical protein